MAVVTFRYVSSLFDEVAEVLAPRLSIIHSKLIRTGCFPLCWRIADVTPVPKGSLSSDVDNYRPISITPFCLKIFERPS